MLEDENSFPKITIRTCDKKAMSDDNFREYVLSLKSGKIWLDDTMVNYKLYPDILRDLVEENSRRDKRNLIHVLSYHRKTKSKLNSPEAPSGLAMAMIYFFFSKNNREELIGDLMEEYPLQVERLGSFCTKLWLWKEVLSAGLFRTIDFVVSLWEKVSPVARFFNKR